jgi:hypothetical protein
LTVQQTAISLEGSSSPCFIAAIVVTTGATDAGRSSAVAIDPLTDTQAKPDMPMEVIENEIPAYRAIHRMAVLSLLLGMLAVMCFADIWFAISAGLAVVTGLFADAKIRRFADVYTGRGLAQTGIALGIIFSLSAVTVTYVQEFKLKRDAGKFAQQYLEILKQGRVADAMWYHTNKKGRRGGTPEEMMKKMEKDSKDQMSYMAHILPTEHLLKRIARPGTQIHYEGIETSGYEELTRVAFVLYEIQGGGGDGAPDHEYALADVRNLNGTGPSDWFVKDFVYPYKANTRVIQPKPVDDGHGHGGH